VRTTRAATGGPDTINREFVEPVQTDKALVLAIEDSALVAERLQTRQRAQERKVVSELDSTDEALVRAIAPMLDGGNGVNDAAENKILGRMRTSYSAYLRVRSRVLSRLAS
jgi:hypothetical protein